MAAAATTPTTGQQQGEAANRHHEYALRLPMIRHRNCHSRNERALHDDALKPAKARTKRAERKNIVVHHQQKTNELVQKHIRVDQLQKAGSVDPT